jgi:drug/metabolite transporter (DMT)-like permease
VATASAPDPASPARRTLVVPGFIALGAIWGSSFLFIKVGVRELHPAYLTLGRVALGAAVIVTLVVVLRHRMPRSPRVWAHLTVVGTFGAAVPFTLFGYGEQRIPSLLAGIWNATTPLVALPLAALVFRTERLTARKIAGVGLGFVGVLVLLGVWQGVGGAALTGQALCFAASACYGFSIAYLKRFVTAEQFSGLALVAGQLLAATAVLAVIAPLAAGPPPVPTQLAGATIGSLLALGTLGSGVALLIHYRNIRLVGASAASLVTYLIPLFAVVVGLLVLGESLTWYQPVGTLIVLSGIAITQGVPTLRRRAAAPVPEPVVAAPAPASPAG